MCGGGGGGGKGSIQFEGCKALALALFKGTHPSPSHSLK